MTAAMPEPHAPRASVIIVSRHRPTLLARCLTALRQQDHPGFEVIVVADPGTISNLDQTDVKVLAFDEANISAARNAGVILSSTDVVAFIDDDAVPEPTWLSRLVAPFKDPAVVAAGGFVRSRNGISFQWAGGRVDCFGRPLPLDVTDDAPVILTAAPGEAIEVKGTNCAYRSAALIAAGGFDPAIRYYLDETAINLRLAARGGKFAVVPLAQVHHFKAESPRRNGRLAPKSLYDVGFSTSVLMRRQFATPEEAAAVKTWLIDRSRAKLLSFMISGDLEPRDITRILVTLDTGLTEGAEIPLPQWPDLRNGQTSFLRFRSSWGQCVSLSGRIWQAGRLRARAGVVAQSGINVTLWLLGPSARAHWMRYDSRGFWEQSGGIYGKSDRKDPLVRFWRFRKRIQHEVARIMTVRCGISAEINSF